MLSVSTIKSASGAGAYYTAEDNYYFLGEQATEWYGTGAESLGLEGPVSREMFTEILEGRLPDGTDLTRMEGDVNRHRPGYDLTFSAPKSVSVLALVTGDKELIEAHSRAVGRALDEVEKLASTRTMSAGVSSNEQTGNLIIARFMHDTNRNLDPNLHDHAVVLNATLSENGWKTLSTDIRGKTGFTDAVWKQQVSIGALYRGFLRQDVESMGYPTTDTGPRGEWDITGVPVKEFSTRRQEILEAVGPDASARQKSVAALDTRNSKEFSDMESVREHWNTVLAETGFDINGFRQLVETGRQKQAGAGEAGAPAMQTGSAGQTGTGASFEERYQLEKPLEKVVREAIDRISSGNVRFSYDDVLTNVLNHIALETGIYGEVREAVNVAIAKGSMLAVDKNQTLFTSPAHVRDEERLLQLASGLADRTGGLVAPQGAKGVMAQVADAGRAVTLIDVRGSNAFVNELNRSIETLARDNDRHLVVVAADAAALKRQSSAFSERQGVILTTAEAFRSSALPEKALVLVSESERFSTTALHDVLKESSYNGAPVLVTDTHARRATGFGSEVLKAAGVTHLSATPATENVSIRMVQKDTVEDRLTVAARYFAQEKASGNDVRLQAGNSRVREQLTTKVRETLAEDGQLGSVLGEINVRVPVWLDASNRNDRSVYRNDMVLERYSGRGQTESFTIHGISDRHNRLTLVDEKGNKTGLQISDVDSHWKLFRKKKLEIREGEQLRATAQLGPRAGSGELLTVTGMKTGRFMFRDRLVMENSKGERVKVDSNAPVYVDYGYTESIGLSRSSTASVVAVLAGKEVTDETVNMLRRSGGNVVAFTPLDETTISRRLAQNRPVVTVTQGIKSLSGEDKLTDALKELEARKMTYPERAVRLAIEKATGTGVTFSSLEVLSGLITDDREISQERASAEMNRLEGKGEIFRVDGAQYMEGQYMTRENFENEKTILRIITQGKNNVTPLVPGGIPSGAATGLTDGQREAGNLILTSRDRIITIQGSAGVGKTTQFRTVAGVLNTMDSPPEIIGLAPTHVAVRELNSAGIPAQTIASFLGEQSRWQAAGQARDFSNTLFVIDESSMNGNAQMASLLTAIDQGNGRAVLNGDQDQLKSLESGAPFALALGRSSADGAVMKEIVRQTPALRPAIEAVIAGNVREALRIAGATRPEVVPRRPDASVPPLSAMNCAGNESKQIYKLITEDYTGRTPEARDGTLIVAELNIDRETINDSIHEKLKEEEVIRDAVTVPLLVRVNNSNADLGRVKFWKEQAGNVMKMGDQHFIIGKALEESGLITVIGQEGAADRWISPAELRKEQVAVFRMVEREIGIGEKIRLTATDRERKISAADMATVTGVTEDGKLQIDTGERTLTWHPSATFADRYLDYGYAVTTYSSQGASVPYVIALVGAEGGRKMMAALDSTYVALSRAKEHIQVYSDNMSKWLSLVEQNSGRRETAHDVLMRAEDMKAERETRNWEGSKPVSETRLSLISDQQITADARFQSGKAPALLWPVINSHGRQRGNWHVPVSPATGDIDFSQAHYEGADDGNRIVLQRGEKQGKILEAGNISQALNLMEANPDSPVVLTTVREEDNESRKPETAAASAGEELQVKDEEALEKAIRNTLGKEEVQEGDEQRSADERTGLTDSDDGEKDRHGLKDIAERELEESRLARYGQDKTDDVLHDRDFRNDEVNIVRHERVHAEPEPKPAPQKTLE